MGTNDNGDAYNITGIGPDNAALIAYLNLTTVLQQGAQYTDARQGAISIAEQAFGVCSPEAIATTDAWAAVGVGGPSPCTTMTVNPNDENKVQNLKIFPNPVSETVFLSFNKTETHLIEIYNVNGLLLKRIHIFGNHTSVDLSNFASGLYIVKLINSDGLYYTRIVKHE